MGVKEGDGLGVLLGRIARVLLAVGRGGVAVWDVLIPVVAVGEFSLQPGKNTKDASAIHNSRERRKPMLFNEIRR